MQDEPTARHDGSLGGRWRCLVLATLTLTPGLVTPACSLIVDASRDHGARCENDRHCLSGYVCEAEVCVPSTAEQRDQGPPQLDLGDAGGTGAGHDLTPGPELGPLDAGPAHDASGPDSGGQSDAGPELPGPTLTLRSEFLLAATLIKGAAFSHDLTEVATFLRSSRVVWLDLDGGPHDPPVRELFNVSDRHLIREFALSPTEPLAALGSGSVDIEAHRLDAPAGSTHLGDAQGQPDDTYRGRLHFDSTGHRVGVLSNDGVVVFELLPSVEELYREPAAGLPDLTHPQMAFFGSDDHITILESYDEARLRLLPNAGGASWGPAQHLDVQAGGVRCRRVTCLVGAAQANVLALCCGEDGVVVIDDPLGSPRRVVLATGEQSPDAVALSPDGSLVAATALEELRLWRHAGPAGVTLVDVGRAEDSVPPALNFSRDGEMLALDRDSRVLVYWVDKAEGE